MEDDPKKEDKNPKEQSLADLRSEIDKLEEKLTETKRQQLILAQERSPTKEIYSWEAPERPFQPKDNNWYAIVGGVSFVTILLAVLTQTFLLIVAVIAVVAILYAMNTIPPKVFQYTILNKGLKIGTKVFTWKQIPKFWIVQRGENIFLTFDVFGGQTNEERLKILVGDGDINIIAKELIRYIDYLDPSEVKNDVFFSFTEGKHKGLGELVEQDLQNSPVKEKQVYETEEKQNKSQ